MTLHQLINHREQVHVGLVSHDPAPGWYFQPPAADQRTHLPLEVLSRTIPPQRQVTHFCPDKSHVFIFCQLINNVGNNALGRCCKIAVDSFQPAWIIMRVRHYNNLQRNLRPQLLSSLKPVFHLIRPVLSSFQPIWL